jgi:hypothetical protein
MCRCKDINLISKYFCIDDRSSEKDLEEIKRLYSFLEIVKTDRPGQAWSYKKMLELVKTEWVLYWEDDWDTVHSGKFITEALDIANADDRIKNVVYRDWQGVYVKDGKIEYRIHHYAPQDCYQYTAVNDCDWYGFSLNPGIQHIPTVKKIGFYPQQKNPTIRGWDKDFAKRYWEAGYRRANTCTGYIDHIGNKRTFYTGN